MSSFDRSKLPEEGAPREAHEDAVQKAVASFNADAVGAGASRKKFEKQLQTFLRKAFEDYKKKKHIFRLMCNAQILYKPWKKKLRAACGRADAKIDEVLQVLDVLLSDYEKSSHGPGKWHKLTKFLEQSLEGLIRNLVKKQIDHVGSEKSSLVLKCRSIEDKMGLLYKQLEAGIHRMETSHEQAQSAQEEAVEWKRKFDVTVRDAKVALEKAAAVQERANKQSQQREDALREEFAVALADKDNEIKNKAAEIEHVEQRLNKAFFYMFAIAAMSFLTSVFIYLLSHTV